MVNSDGRRFVNEATNYNDLGRVLQNSHPSRYGYENLPAFLVFDHRFHRNYSVAGQPKGTDALGVLTKADSLPELAALIGVSPEGLEETVSRFNKQRRAGS